MMKVRIRSKLDSYLDRIYEEKGIRISKSWLARQVYADPSQIHRWSKNKDDGFIETAPNVGYAILIAQTLKCNVDDIFEIELVPEDEFDLIFTTDK